MNSFSSYIFRKAYQKIQKLGDRLAEIDPLIDWEAFRPIIQGLYDNQGPKGGRPNVDEVVMVKMLVLQSWYGLSDPELERQANDRLSFRRFLGFPDVIPDSTTVWLFRERLAESGRDRLVWEELQRQLDGKGLSVKKGVVQDASFITSDPGHARADKPRGEEARTRRSGDGSWAKKGASHTMCTSFTPSRMSTRASYGSWRRPPPRCTTAGWTSPGRGRWGIWKAYFGVEPMGYDATMRRGVRGHPLGIRDRLRNRLINRKRAPGERPFAVIKRVFGSGHVALMRNA